MSLPDDRVFSMLSSDFEVGWKNIEGEDYVGHSFGYSRQQCAVGTTNGAGAHNVQMFVLAPDGVVLHALPGFWHPEDLARELRFAAGLLKVWSDSSRTRAQKDQMFMCLQRAEARYQPPTTSARSGWQSFDQFHEIRRLQAGKQGPRDMFRRSEDGYLLCNERGAPMLKPLNVLLHERMAQQPFKKFDEFDIVAFTDYGQKFYDNNRRHTKPRGNFTPPKAPKPLAAQKAKLLARK